MDRPEHFVIINSETKRVNQECLDKYGNKIKWKNSGKAILEVGCADGSFTSIFRKNYVPNNYEKFIACDISVKMINFANDHHKDEDITFKVWDIQSEVPGEFEEAFDHVFSFLTFHWVPNQEKAFQNIYKILAEGGDCFVTIIGSIPIYKVYSILSRKPKWSDWLKNLEEIAFVYHNIQNPEKKITEMLKRIGYKDVEVICKEKYFAFKTIDGFKFLIKALDPFHMPEDILEEFTEDFIKTIQDMNDFKNIDEPGSIKYNYNEITVHASK